MTHVNKVHKSGKSCFPINSTDYGVFIPPVIVTLLPCKSVTATRFYLLFIMSSFVALKWFPAL